MFYDSKIAGSLIVLCVLLPPFVVSNQVKPETSRYAHLPWWHTKGLFSGLQDAGERRSCMSSEQALLVQRVEHMQREIPELLELVSGSSTPKLEELFDIFLPARARRERLPDNLHSFFDNPYPCSNRVYHHLLLINAFMIDNLTCSIVPDRRFSSMPQRDGVSQATTSDATTEDQSIFFLPEFLRKEMGVVEPVLNTRSSMLSETETSENDDQVKANEDELEALIKSKLDLSSTGSNKGKKRSKGGKNKRKNE
ncbi:hypothetical protein GUITHDRAFT_108323 [Guillardia theta CCMP2712]|uniref:Uncharacterized protein n=1 Tax=Guillardia theta (strain CCMP2712) TaxID=905079 RepID=L1JCP7_GUITC|nr:hypothetical protein GUITHDRAFT_108323 [Guillardia theta CCMP2712]EKX45870.1 hypothetical protein GUITHDRAFT_108323 [Guillardia theta CCMP2712]|eukprot:XP_005832850.1 hypothetical protein GUITHDRAFT_108323 [Guillardia theta CCMP2712]